MVVGYDGSESASVAVRWAAATLPAEGSLVLVCSCRPLHAPPSPLACSQERRSVGHAVFDALALEAQDAFLAHQACTEVSDEDPVSALTDAARRHRACMIVVGCEQHSRLHRAIGTVTSELLKRSPVPVVAVPSGSTESSQATPRRTG